MNTITNFNVQNTNVRQNNPKSNINFQGRTYLKPSMMPKFLLREEIADKKEEIAHILHKAPEAINDLTKNASTKRLYFLDLLAEKLNVQRYVKKASHEELKKDTDTIIDIYNKTKHPNKGHYFLASGFKGSFDDINRIINATGGKESKLKFAEKLHRQVLCDNGFGDIKRPQITAELLESKHADSYVKDFPKYKSYLILHKNDENAVKNLDAMIDNKTFDPKKYDIQINLNHIFSKSSLHETPIFNKETLTKHYTDEGFEALDTFFQNFGPSKESVKAGNDKDIMDIYKTTTKSNLGIRKKIMNKFQYSQFNDVKIKEKNEQISDLNVLFKKIDEDPNVGKFMLKLIPDDAGIRLKPEVNTIGEYNRILDAVPAKKLNIFYRNAENIMYQTKGQERIKALQENIENPFFMTERVKEIRDYNIQEGFEKAPSIFSQARKFVANKFNQLRDKITPDAKKPVVRNEVKELDKANSKPVINIIEPIELPKANEVKPVIDINSKAVEQVKPEEVVNIIKPIELPKANEVKPVIDIDSKVVEKAQSEKIINDVKPIIKSEPKDIIKDVKNDAIDKGFVKEQVESTNTIDKSAKLTKTAPKLPNAKKLAVINDVNGVIEKKLGAKTLGEQKSDYAKKATKMRLNMLPEIFASIKETRAADRAAGKKATCSNKDALALYEKINGKNKKLVNYMLKKRNADGTRKFNIKDIITTLDDAEKQVIQNKKIAPKQYNAQSERNYYNNIFDTNVAIYGQLEKAKKQTVKQK